MKRRGIPTWCKNDLLGSYGKEWLVPLRMILSKLFGKIEKAKDQTLLDSISFSA
jgi:hypothetical protein